MSTPDTEHDSPPNGLPNQSIDEDSLPWDILCAECRYNLRGLTSKHCCPECGHPVLESLKGCYEALPLHAIDGCRSITWKIGGMLFALGIAYSLTALAPAHHIVGLRVVLLMISIPCLGLAIFFSIISLVRRGCRRTWRHANKRLKLIALGVLTLAAAVEVACIIHLRELL
jgi:hypothetical protein